MANKAPSIRAQHAVRVGLVVAIGALTHWNLPAMVLAYLASLPYVCGRIIDPKLTAAEKPTYDAVRITASGDVERVQ